MDQRSLNIDDDIIETVSLGDFFKHSDKLYKRKYDRPDHRHADLDLPYPGMCCMQWFSLFNETTVLQNNLSELTERNFL